MTSMGFFPLILGPDTEILLVCLLFLKLRNCLYCLILSLSSIDGYGVGPLAAAVPNLPSIL